MASIPETDLPPLWRDRSFWGMTITQFLGAFNDNLFKQLILLFCLDLAGGDRYQTIAAALFALPFVLFSGFAGFLADKHSKRKIIVLSKVAEIVVMALGLIAFAMGFLGTETLLWMLLIVLAFMGIQSAFFGPSKYGILPEMLRNDDLPQANGIIQMTTFLAIIMGTALAGYGKETVGSELWKVSLACVGIAIVGTLTSLAVRRTPIAKPGLEFEPSALAMTASTRQLLWGDKLLLGVLMISSLFWFVGGVVLLAVNQLGKDLMQLGDGRTSMLSACMGLGIGVGCVLAGQLSKHEINFKIVRQGAWGMALFLILVPLVSFPVNTTKLLEVPAGDEVVVDNVVDNTVTEENNSKSAGSEPSDTVADALTAHWQKETLWEKLFPINFWEFATRITLIGAGLCAGLFAVPLQTFLQSRPPADQKGQMIGAMNLINWIGILLAAFFLGVLQTGLNEIEFSQKWVFPILALMIVPVALFFKPPTEKLSHQVGPHSSVPGQADNPVQADNNPDTDVE
ncbi:MAG: hypothetical protein CMJ46_02595 [Planctomyces sp.]|nr:hypothetical protein [Planctomyces sp.]